MKGLIKEKVHVCICFEKLMKFIYFWKYVKHVLYWYALTSEKEKSL